MPPTWGVGPAAESSSRSRRRPSLAVPVDQVVDQVRSTARTDRLGVVPVAGQAVWQRGRTRHAVGSTTPGGLVRYVLLAGVFGLFGLAIVLLALLLSDERGAAPLVIQAPANVVTVPMPSPVEVSRPPAVAPAARPAPAKGESAESKDDGKDEGKDDESGSSGDSGGSSVRERRSPAEESSRIAGEMARDWTGWYGPMPDFSRPGFR